VAASGSDPRRHLQDSPAVLAAAPVLAGTTLTRKQISPEIAKVPGHRGAVWTIDLQEGVREKKQVLSIFSKYQRGPKPYLLAILHKIPSPFSLAR
jgi:hypothetical protein